MESELSLLEVLEMLKSFGIETWCALLVATITFAIEVFLVSKGIIKTNKEKFIQKAKTEGKMITANRVNCYHKNRNTNTNKNTGRVYIAAYEYMVDGKKRKKGVVSENGAPPYTITLYYGKNHNKVISEYDNFATDYLQIGIYIVPIVVAYMVMRMMGAV